MKLFRKKITYPNLATERPRSTLVTLIIH